MATVVIKDILDGDSVSHSPERFYEHTRVFLVTGVAGNTNGERAYSALQASGIPLMFDGHPFIPFIGVQSRDVKMVEGSPSVARITIKYGFPSATGQILLVPGLDPEDAQVETGTALISVETNKQLVDNDGDFSIQIPRTILVTGGAGGQEPETIYQPASVQAFKPEPSVRYTRREPITLQDLMAKSRVFVGTINQNPAFGDAAHYWMCMRLDGSSSDGGQTYVVTYEFVHNDESWNPDVIWTDENTGQPLAGATPGNGLLENVRIFKDKVFQELNLTL